MVDFNLQPGVNLHVEPTTRFHVNRIVVNFATPQTATNATARNLLANLLETSTAKYPTQTDFALALNHLYGAEASAGVVQIGLVHNLRVRAEVIDDRYATPGLFAQLVELVAEMIFNPLIKNQSFDEATFKTQQKNIANELASIKENKQYYAATQLDQLFYDENAIVKVPSYGTLEQLQLLDPASLVNTYQEMLAHDQIDIFVFGNVNPDEVYQLFAQWPLSPRKSPLPADIFYHQAFNPQIRQLVEHQDVNQAKLNIAYHFPVSYRDPNHVPALVMNGILGGSPYSKLFTNVREKASLAYYASSHPRFFSNYLAIQTGIDGKNYQQALDLIQNQVKAVQNGDFSDTIMQEVKDSLINHYQTGLDSPGNLVERLVLGCLTKRKPVADTIAAINDVTREQVAQLANQLQLQAIYFLDGEK